MKSKTELDEKFEYPDDPEFPWSVIILRVVAMVFTGVITLLTLMYLANIKIKSF